MFNCSIRRLSTEVNAGDFETQVGFCSVLNELCNVGRSVSMPATEEINDVPAYYL